MARLPAAHASENQKLQADAYVELWEIALVPSGIILIKNDDSVTWQNKLYESCPVKLSGAELNADAQKSRPTLSVANPDKKFNPYIDQGVLEKATVTRLRVLRSDIDNDRNIFQSRSWVVARPAKLVGVVLTLELREMSDGPNHKIPGRQFVAPEFPVVTLG